MKRLTRGGLPIDGADWSEEDWRDLHDAVEGIKRRVAARHRGEPLSELLTANEARARVVGNAVYLEHVGMSGDIVSWGMGSAEQAEEVAGAINGLLNELRHWLADGAQKAGEYAHETAKGLERLEAELETTADKLSDCWLFLDSLARCPDSAKLRGAAQAILRKQQAPGWKE